VMNIGQPLRMENLANPYARAFSSLSIAFSRFSILVANEIRMYPGAPNAEPGTIAISPSSRRYSASSRSLEMFSIRSMTP